MVQGVCVCVVDCVFQVVVSVFCVLGLLFVQCLFQIEDEFVLVVCFQVYDCDCGGIWYLVVFLVGGYGVSVWCFGSVEVVGGCWYDLGQVLWCVVGSDVGVCVVFVGVQCGVGIVDGYVVWDCQEVVVGIVEYFQCCIFVYVLDGIDVGSLVVFLFDVGFVVVVVVGEVVVVEVQ